MTYIPVKINMQHKLDELSELLQLFQSVEHSQLNETLMTYFEEVMDNSISKLDQCYYELMVNKNKKIAKKIKSDKHFTIMHSQGILNAFMPYIIAYSTSTI